MTVQQIRLAGDQILRVKCQPIRDFAAAAPLITDLKDTLLDFKRREGLGRGIAAPQIGVTQRAIYVITNEFESEMINPKIVAHSDTEFVCWDACFSFGAAIFAKVRRWEGVTVEYQDKDGKKHKLVVTDLALSELLQHEIDHLDGILFVDRILRGNNGQVDIIMRAEWENQGKPFRVSPEPN